MKVYFAFAAAVALPAAALAQQEDRIGMPAAQAPQARTAPVMDGHQFAPSVLIDTPFRETTFTIGLLYGFGDATGNQYEVSNGTVQVVGQAQYTFATFAQTFRYEHQFVDWFSAGATVITSLYSGIDGPSVVSVGAQVGIGFGLRVKAGQRLGPIQTAIIVDASTEPQYGILVAAAIIKAIQDRVIDTSAALQSTHTLNVSPTVAASWAPFPALGLTANVGYIFKSLRLSGTNIADQSGILIGGLVDFDFAKIGAGIPVGLLAAYRLSTPVGDTGISKIEDFTGGIFYTAHRELGLGLEVGRRSFTIRPPLDSTVTVAQIALQYYW